MIKKNNPKEYMKKKERNFTQEMINDTLKYQKQYEFKIGENNSAHNNESDAFRHAYMQAILSQKYGNWAAKTAGDIHEYQGNQRGQDPREANMDLWNNRQGREIAIEINKEYPNFKSLPENQQKDIIAQKVVQRIKEGQLITGLEDSRQYKDTPNIPFTPTRGIGGVWNNAHPTGFGANIGAEDIINNILSSGVIDNVSQILSGRSPFVSSIVDMQQTPVVFQEKPYTYIPGMDKPYSPWDNKRYYSNSFINPFSGSNRIFTREDVGAMSLDEYEKNEKAIMAQVNAMGGTMPTNGDLEYEARTTGGVVYVNAYTRADGTHVKGYYRSR